MKKLDKEIWIVAAKRTPFGAMGGAFKGLSATELGVHAAKAALAQSGLEPGEIDHVVFGNVQQTSADAIYCARHVGLKSGLPIETPAITVNRLCGSGFQAVVSAAQDILVGDAKAVLCGGTENMSQAPHSVWGLRDGARFGQPPALVDTLWASLTDSHCNTAMAVTAENLAEKYGITRTDCDAFALASQTRWAAANERGGFADELAAVEIEGRKGPITVSVDEHPRPASTMETLGKLPPVFKKDGVVSAGNASGICDGAAALVVCDGAWAKGRGLAPLAKLLQWGIAGVEPTLMGIGPAPAIRSALDRAGLALGQVDWFDVNEAFAAQWLAVQRELGLPEEKSNPNGGAIALGHPLGASGARITANLVYQLRRTDTSVAVGSACIGGGQGIALVLERA
ncbi:MAG: thiolase family protein [Sandaracinaceae bacterium]|nr:thiolase family protein [Sandaracinaceae bacterium]